MNLLISIIRKMINIKDLYDKSFSSRLKFIFAKLLTRVLIVLLAMIGALFLLGGSVWELKQMNFYQIL